MVRINHKERCCREKEVKKLDRPLTEQEFDDLCTLEVDNNPKEVDKRLSYTIHRLEGESGHHIDEHYSYFKFISKIRYYGMIDSLNKRKK